MNRQKKALICGMAKSGVASARLLAKDGYVVTINDIKAEIPGLMDALCGIEYTDALGQDPMELVEGQDLVVLSPVIPIFAPFAKKARELGAEVIGEIELGYRYCAPGTRFVCISGTNGKTTTVLLLENILKSWTRNTGALSFLRMFPENTSIMAWGQEKRQWLFRV